jgi:hypothetical protein
MGPPCSPTTRSSVNGSCPIVGDGGHPVRRRGAYGGNEPATAWFFSAAQADPAAWKPVFTPVTTAFGGSTLRYDLDHHVLYSTHLTGG